MPTRRWWALVLLPVLAGAAAWAFVANAHRSPAPSPGETEAPSRPTARPNVLLVSLDTLRPDHLGCYGYGKDISPNLDAFAAGAVRFTNCRSQAPWTLPSQMALLTSMPPADNGVDNLNKVLPAEIPTLPELLRGAGYRTAALVNNGQLRAHWGFQRGFDTWREFEVDRPEGNCENVTARALAWLKSDEARSPFFLFLHYYDAHDPYDAPEPYRRQTGTTLTGEEARRLSFGHRFPGQEFRDPRERTDLIAAYDAAVAWLDHELGRLLAAVPANTLIVLFSDHGEAFKEHGWTLHGATLYEEEIRTLLLMRPPDGGAKPPAVDESVMLLDVAPTVLALCGVRPPVSFQGADLTPLLSGGVFKERLVPSETKAVLEGRLLLSATLYPLKGIYSLFDGRFEVYRLPDERTPLGGADRAAAQPVVQSLRDRMAGEQFWMIHAAGKGDFEADVELSEGRLGLFIPVGLDPLRDSFDVLDGGRAVRWHVYPGGKPKSLFLQPERPDAALRVDFKVNGSRAKEMAYLGSGRTHPGALPATVPADLAPVSPVIEKPFAAGRDGFYVLRHRAAGGRARPGKVQQPDEETIRRLRSLGYMR